MRSRTALTDTSTSTTAPRISSRLKSSGSVSWNDRCAPASSPMSASARPGKQALAVDVEVAILLLLAAEHLLTTTHHQRAAQHVTRLRRALDVAQLAVATAQLLDHLVDLLVGDLGGRDVDAQAAVVTEVHLRAHRDGGGEHERLAALDGLHVELGVVDGLNAGLVERARVELGEERVDGLLAHRLPADRALHHRRGRLAGSEPGEPDPPREPAQRGGDGRLQLRGGRLDAQLDTRVGLALDGHVDVGRGGGCAHEWFLM